MEMIVVDMAIDMMDKIDIIEGKIFAEVGLHNHILANFLKVGFGFAKEAKLAKE